MWHAWYLLQPVLRVTRPSLSQVSSKTPGARWTPVTRRATRKRPPRPARHGVTGRPDSAPGRDDPCAGRTRARLAELEFRALLSEFHRDIDAYLGTRRGPRDLAGLIEFNRTHPREQTCFVGQELFEQALAVPPTTDPKYRAMRTELTDLSRRSLDETPAAHRLDAIAAPTNPPAWTTDCARGDSDVIASSTPAAVAGYPSLSVPAGSVGERPVGLLLTAGDREDAGLLSLGATVERRLQAWRTPRYLPSVGAAVR